MKFKDIVDLFSLQYATLKIICPIIVSAEFLKRAKKEFLKATDRTLRAAIITSQLGLAGGPPPPSPKEFTSGPGISTGLRPEQASQQTEEEKVTAEIRRIFESRNLAAVERKISPDSFAWLTTANRYLFLSVEQAMGIFREAFGQRQPQCLAFRISGEGENKKISVLMKDFGVIKWNGELSTASFVSLTPYRGNWFISSIGEFSGALENVQRNLTDLRPCPPGAPENQEQRVSSEVSVFGVSAEFTDNGNVVISSIDGRRKEIKLPPLAEFYSHYGGMAFSPDGTKLIVWRDSHDKGKEGYSMFLVSPQTGELKPVFSSFVRSLDYLPRVIDLEWSQNSKKLRIASGHHGRGKGIVVDIDTEQALFEYRGGIYGRFSPDGNWFARVEEKDLEVRRISDGYRFIIRNNDSFSWSPDSSSLVFNRCLMWKDGVWGPECMYTQLALYDLVKGEQRNLDYSEPYAVPFFSPSGEKVFFRQRANTRLTHFSVLNVRDGKNSIIDLTRFVDQGFELVNWDWRFYGEETVLGYGGKRNDPRLYFFWIDVANGSVKKQQWLSPGRDESVKFKSLFDAGMIFEVWNKSANRWEYRIAPITERGGQLEIVQRIPLLRSAEPFSHGDDLFAVLREGNQFRVGEQNFLFLGGRKYLIEHEESAEYFGGQRDSIPEGLAWFIPEGEKIGFLPGDVVGDKDLGIWYLRNGKRYKIQNWDRFVERQRFDRGVWPVPAWVIERIPTGEVPEPILGREGILDWDGKIKEYQPFGGRMIIFMGGYAGNTTSQLEAFQPIKTRLIERWSERQFLEATYKVEINAPRKLIVPRAYFSQDTKVYPPQSFSKLRLQIERYKQMFPMTKFILVGHSLGGPMVFEAAAAHTDAIEAVISLDGSIEGIDKAFLIEVPELLDPVVSALGDDVIGYMNVLGDDSVRRQEQEDKALWLRGRKVRVFTFSNDDDWLVRNRVAVLSSSDSEFEGRPVRLIWQLGHFEPRSVEDLLSGHEQILKEESFLEELARILPAS